jgi:hypothetical protein
VRASGLEHALTFASSAEAFDVEWVTRATHERAVEWRRTADRRLVSLVDFDSSDRGPSARGLAPIGTVTG